MTGHGTAYGAVSILNATATGIGCALAVDGGASATWSPRRDGGIHLKGGPDDRLVRAVAAQFNVGGDVAVTCVMPPARGLKTSSSVAAALVRAAADATQASLPARDVEQRAVDASRQAGVTLTGAYDDQVATVRGGCHLTDNATSTLLAAVAVAPWHVAIWVPAASIAKAQVRGLDATAAQRGARQAEAHVRAGDIPTAMTANGRTFHALYAAAGLPVNDDPARVALAAGALGAGLSGTGPAVAALFEDAVELPEVPGGTWRWTRAVPT